VETKTVEESKDMDKKDINGEGEGGVELGKKRKEAKRGKRQLELELELVLKTIELKKLEIYDRKLERKHQKKMLGKLIEYIPFSQ
jgi:hypothetical protein